MASWLLRPVVRWRAWTFPTFMVVGTIAVLAGAVVGCLLGRAVDVPPSVLATMVVVLPLVFLLTVAAQAAVRGQVNLVAFRDAGVTIGTTGACCAILEFPLRAGLDIVAVTMAVILAIARLGCLAGGCCHGRPARHGVRYSADHAELGFPAALVGVTLVPVPAWEAAALMALAPVGVSLTLSRPSGTAFGFLVASYAIVRVVLERLRGDIGRPRRAGLPSVVWTAGGIGAILVVLVVVGLLPALILWPAALAVATVIAMAASGLLPDRARTSRLLAPEHVAELAVAVHARSQPTTTSSGLRISHGRVDTPEGLIDHYTLSRAQPLKPIEVRALATLLRHLRHPHQQINTLSGPHGVAHLVTVPSQPCE